MSGQLRNVDTAWGGGGGSHGRDRTTPPPPNMTQTPLGPTPLNHHPRKKPGGNIQGGKYTGLRGSRALATAAPGAQNHVRGKTDLARFSSLLREQANLPRRLLVARTFLS